MSTQRLPALDPNTATGKNKDLFNAVHGMLGSVPNMMRTMANSPAVLDAYLAFSGALGKGTLGAKLGEQVALTVANANGCGYCNAAHGFIGENLAKLDKSAIELARHGKAVEPKDQAALTLARVVTEKRGHISDSDFNAARAGGLSDAAIAEVIAHVALNILTNYINSALGTAIDFPEVELVDELAVV